jgi:hypothetical protein
MRFSRIDQVCAPDITASEKRSETKGLPYSKPRCVPVDSTKSERWADTDGRFRCQRSYGTFPATDDRPDGALYSTLIRSIEYRLHER